MITIGLVSGIKEMPRREALSLTTPPGHSIQPLSLSHGRILPLEQDVRRQQLLNTLLRFQQHPCGIQLAPPYGSIVRAEYADGVGSDGLDLSDWLGRPGLISLLPDHDPSIQRPEARFSPCSSHLP